jgi:hypothetical protein
MLHERDAYHPAWHNTQSSNQILSLMAETMKIKIMNESYRERIYIATRLADNSIFYANNLASIN